MVLGFLIKPEAARCYNALTLEVFMDSALESKIGTLLKSKGLTLATAESFTGGLIGDRLTDIPGSSDYFLGGMIAYANAAKVSQLGVSPLTLEQHGAVSRETVLEMAAGVRQRLGANLGLSSSGIAGPGGGSPQKPIGTAWVGLVAADGCWARLFHLPGERCQVKQAGAEAALQMLLDYLEGQRDLEAWTSLDDVK